MSCILRVTECNLFIVCVHEYNLLILCDYVRLYRVIVWLQCRAKMQDEDSVSPVTEVAIFLQKEKIRDGIDRRTFDRIRPARNPYSRPALPIPTGQPALPIPAHAEAAAQTATDHRFIDMTAGATSSTSDESGEDTFDYSQCDPAPAVDAGVACAIPTAATV